MADFVTLAELKRQCRADDGDYDDALLGDILDDAEAWVLQATRRSTTELLEMGGGMFPRPLRRAVLMLGAHWYKEAEATGSANLREIPYAMSTLVKPYIKLTDR